jgi:CRISPR-associated protein Cas2
MHAVLVYDISSDRARAKVADACLDYGLSRIQYSAFFGEISANHLEELLQRIRRLVGRGEASVEVFPICQKDLRLRRNLKSARLAPPARPGRPPKQTGEQKRAVRRDPARELLAALEALPETGPARVADVEIDSSSTGKGRPGGPARGKKTS